MRPSGASPARSPTWTGPLKWIPPTRLMPRSWLCRGGGRWGLYGGDRAGEVGIITGLIRAWSVFPSPIVDGEEQTMRDPSRVRVPGPLESYAEDFRGELAGRGYSPDAAAVQLQLMGHLSRWLAGQGLDPTGLTPAVVDAYLAERRSLGCASHWTRRALAPLLGFLQRREVAPASVASGPAGPVEALLGRYARWLAAERGLAETTIRRNVELVRPFVAGWERAGRVEL